MLVVKRFKVVVERLVLYAEPGEPELLKLIDPNNPDYEGWTLDWHRWGKFVLKREIPESREVERPWKKDLSAANTAGA